MFVDTIKLENYDQISILRLAQPRTLNAMSPAMADEFEAAIASVQADQETRVLIITGCGDSFSSGGDLNTTFSMYQGSPVQAKPKVESFYKKFLTVRTLEIPTIASIKGNVIGAALCLALACDMRVASTDVSMTMSFIKLGLSPGMGGTYLLPRLIGTAQALEMFLTGGLVKAEEALRVELVNHVVDTGELERFSLDLAGRIAQNAPVAARLIKKTVYQGLSKDLETCLEYEAMAQLICASTQDMQEGVAAVKEKRAPSFKGR